MSAWLPRPSDAAAAGRPAGGPGAAGIAKPWSMADLDTPLLDIIPCDLLVFTDHRSISVDLALNSEGKPTGTTALMLDYGKHLPLMQDMVTLRDLATAALGPDARVMYLPPVVPRREPARGFLVAWGISACAVFAWVSWVGTWGLFFIGLGLVLCVIPLVLVKIYASMAKRLKPEIVVGAAELGLEATDLHGYALAVSRGELWRGALPPGAPVSPALQVARIREEYARLRTDLIYRIENPALFDPAVPTTAAFEQALVDFDDAPEAEREQRAAQVEVRFTVAMQHAERVGFRHAAPEYRGELMRAAKVARLAAAAGSDGERRAALVQLQRIVESLALYYLPSRTDHPELGAPE